MSQIQRRYVQVRGAQDYSADGRFRIAFDDIQPLAGWKQTYVAGVVICIDLVNEKDNAGTSSLPGLLARRILKECVLRQKGSGHTFLNLAPDAGVDLYLHEWRTTGRRPQNPAAITIPATGSTITTPLKVSLPFQLGDGVEPGDHEVCLADLKGSQIECQWADADANGIFDAGANNERATSATTVREVIITLVGRDEYRRVTWTLERHIQNGPQDHLPVEQASLLGVTEVPVQVDGLTETFISDAARDQLTLKVGSAIEVDRVDAKDLCAEWNRNYARTADDELPDHEDNATPFVPVVFGHRPIYAGRKITHSVAVKGIKPNLKVEGTSTSPTVLLHYQPLNKFADVVGAVNRGEIDVPPGFGKNPGAFLEPKTHAKTPVGKGAQGIQRFPIKLSESGDKRAEG